MTSKIEESDAAEYLHYPSMNDKDKQNLKNIAIKFWEHYIKQQTQINKGITSKTPHSDNFIIHREQSNDRGIVFLTSLFSPHKNQYDITIESTDSICFSVYSEQCDFYMHNDNDEELKKCIQEHNLKATGEVTINGKILNNLKQYSIMTDLFDITYEAENPYNEPSGRPIKSRIHGVFIYLKPLSQSHNHVLKYSVKEPLNTSNHKYESEVTYNIKVN
jgi:predicted small metal-binding protein